MKLKVIFNFIKGGIMKNITPAEQSTGLPCVGRLTFCSNGIVHLDYGSITLHFTALGFLQLMATGQEAVERIRCTMEGAGETGFVH